MVRLLDQSAGGFRRDQGKMPGPAEDAVRELWRAVMEWVEVWSELGDAVWREASNAIDQHIQELTRFGVVVEGGIAETRLPAPIGKRVSMPFLLLFACLRDQRPNPEATERMVLVQK